VSSIAVVAGDASGDLYGASLAHALRKIVPDVTIWGAGGPRMEAAKVELVADFSLVSSIGVVESSKTIPSLLISYLRLRTLIRYRRPDALVVIDFGGFNRRLSGFARRIGVKTVYFIPPGCWRRMNRGTAKTAKCADLFLTPFQWSAERLRVAGANVEYVGHPLLDVVEETRVEKTRFCMEFGLDVDTRIVALLPGSRKAEISHILPVLLDAADIIRGEAERVQFVVAAAPGVFEMVRRGVGRRACDGARVIVIPNRACDTLAAADLALVASGTATLEAAILGTPMVIVYRGSVAMAAEKILRNRVLEDYIGLPNIIAGQGICPELVGKQATGRNIAVEAIRLLEDNSLREETKWNLSKVRSQLGQPGAVRRSAELIAKFAGLQAR